MFVSCPTIYEDNNGAIVVAKFSRMTPTSEHIDVKYYWFRQHVGKEFVIPEDQVRKSEGIYFHQRFTR